MTTVTTLLMHFSTLKISHFVSMETWQPRPPWTDKVTN